MKKRNVIGVNIKNARKTRILTQRELSKLTGISEIVLYIYENGLKEPTLGDLRKIAIALNISTDYILGRIY